MLQNYNLDLLNYTVDEIEVIEEALLKCYNEEVVARCIEDGDFVLYNNCFTLTDVIKYIELEYGDCSATVQELDACNTWAITRLGIIMCEY